MRPSPLRGERQANLREKNGKTSRFGRKKRAGATAFSLRVFSECRQAYPHHLPPFPAGRVFTGAACGEGSPMRKGVCYALLCYAILCYVYQSTLSLHLWPISATFKVIPVTFKAIPATLQHFPAAQPGGLDAGAQFPVVLQPQQAGLGRLPHGALKACGGDKKR